MLQCSSNGLTLSRLSHEGPQQESLHMFFSGFPYIYGLQYFPNVRLVQIMGQTLTSMNGLQHCQLLKELWISDCQLTVSALYVLNRTLVAFIGITTLMPSLIWKVGTNKCHLLALVLNFQTWLHDRVPVTPAMAVRWLWQAMCLSIIPGPTYFTQYHDCWGPWNWCLVLGA